MSKIISTLVLVLLVVIANNSLAQWNLTGNSNATNTSIVGTTNAVNLNLATRNLTRLVIDSNGRVGIGTTTLPNIFSVKGSGGIPNSVWVNSGNPLFTGFGEQTVGNADFILSMASSAFNARPVFIGRRAKGTLAAPAIVANNDQIMSFLSSGYDGTAFQNAAAIDFFVDGTPAAGSVPTRISFVTGSNSATRAERLKIGNTGDITVNTNQLFVQRSTGNVGIGTILPQAKLDITGQVKISGGSPGTGKVLTSDAAGLATWQAVPVVAETDPEVAVTDTSAVPRWNGAALVNGTIKDDGTNVGIGTATPTAKLDVTGNIKIADGTQGVGKVLTSDATGLSTWQDIPAPVETDPKVGSLSVNKIPKWNGTTLTDGTITDNSNVGIGESNPQGILHVSQAGIFSGVAFAGTGLNDLTANISGYTGTGTTTYVIKINNAGPTPNLIQVSSNGGSSFSGAFPIANPINMGFGVTATFASTGGHTFADQWTWSVSKGFNDLLVVDSGRVGINTKTPTTTLDVVGGDARINGMTVGRGKGNDSTNTAIGVRALANNSISSFFFNNTAVGFNALLANTEGTNNVAIGSQALLSNTTGVLNTAVGIEALQNNTTGERNIAIGSQVLQNNTSGSFNSGVGSFSLSSNRTGYSNTAIGREALTFNRTGFSKVGVGRNALSRDTSGSQMVAIGDSALFNQNGGNGLNTAVGFKALFANKTGASNTANGFQSLFANTTGSSNVAVGNSSLRSNTTGSNLVAIGDSALFANTTGASNTANGYQSLFSNTTGFSNVAIGISTLRSNAAGSNLVAIGDSALFNQNGGSGFNTALGSKVLFANTTGAENTGVGFTTLFNTTTGSFNTALGTSALVTNTTGSNNVAVGTNSLVSNTTGAGNTVCGVSAMRNNISGFSNAAFGIGALRLNTTGNNNVALGDSTLRNNTGNDNTAVGSKAYSNNFTNFSNASALGANTAITGSDMVRLGASTVTSIGGQVGYTTISDGRFKTNIQTNVPGIEFINKLKPVIYKLNVAGIDQFTGVVLTTKEQLKAREHKSTISYTGFIAQEVEQAAREIGYDFSGVDAPKNDKDMYGLRYAEFVVPLVKAVQELSIKNEQLTTNNEQLIKQNADTKKELQKQIDELKAMMQQLLNTKSNAPCPPLAGK